VVVDKTAFMFLFCEPYPPVDATLKSQISAQHTNKHGLVSANGRVLKQATLFQPWLC
jgi:hypothetical protein